MKPAISVNQVSMNFDMGRGKVRSVKERILQHERSEKYSFIVNALSDVSFEVSKGEIFGIVGANGAGKSTLLKIISGIMEPTSGSVTVNGVIAPMVELGTGFDFELSGLENIYLNGAVLGFRRQYISERIVDILNFAELWEFKDIPVKYYSSGMVARLGFAASTFISPDVLIVDEILAVGDIAFQKKSLARMLEVMRNGATVVYVSHDIGSVRKLCARSMWLDKGIVRMIDETTTVCDAYETYMYRETEPTDAK